MTLAYDSDGWLDLAQAKAQGAVAVGLYLGGNLTQAAADNAGRLGIGLWCFFERQSWDPDGGSILGEVDAKAAADHADQLKGARGCAIYMPNDQEITNYPATLAYFEEAASVLRERGYRPGIYGQESLWENYLRTWYDFFCHAPDGTMSPYPGANIVQNVSPQIQIEGVSCDVDELMTPGNFGGWNALGLWPAQPVPTTKDLPVLFIATANAAGTDTTDTAITQGEQFLIDTSAPLKVKLAGGDTAALAAALHLPEISLGPHAIAGFPG